MTTEPLSASAVMRGNRQFLLLWIAQLIFAAGNGVGALVEPIYLLRGGAPLALGYFAGAATLATLASLPIGGALADSYSRGLLIRSGFLVSAGSSLLLVASDGRNVAMVIGSAVLSGCGWGLSLPATRAMVVDLVGLDKIAKAQSLVMASQSFLALIGPVAAGALSIVFAPRSLLLAEAAGDVVAACIVPLIRRSDQPGATTVTSRDKLSVRNVLAATRVAVRVPWVVAGSVQTTIQVVIAFAPGFVLIRYVGEPRYGQVGLGVVIAASGLASLLGAMAAGRWSPARPGLWANIGFMSFAGVQLCIAVDVPLPVFCAAIVVGGFGISFHGIWWYAAINRRFPAELRGRINALDMLSAKLLEPVGMALAIPVVTVIGTTSVALVGLVTFLVVPLLALLVPGLACYSDGRETAADPVPDQVQPAGHR